MVISLAVLFLVRLYDEAGLTDVTCSRCPDQEGVQWCGASPRRSAAAQKKPLVSAAVCAAGGCGYRVAADVPGVQHYRERPILGDEDFRG
jgi:hypothetical protein